MLVVVQAKNAEIVCFVVNQLVVAKAGGGMLRRHLTVGEEIPALTPISSRPLVQSGGISGSRLRNTRGGCKMNRKNNGKILTGGEPPARPLFRRMRRWP